MCLLIMLNNFMSMSVVRSDLTNQVSDKNILVMMFKTTQYTCVGTLYDEQHLLYQWHCKEVRIFILLEQVDPETRRACMYTSMRISF